MLFSKKYKPKYLTDIKHNEMLRKNLINLSKSPDFLHVLLYGPKYSGKYTFVKCFLNSRFNEEVLTKKT